MFVLNLPTREKIIIIFIITLVLTLELINSQIERILNILQPNYDLRVKIIKDISAAAVLIACFGSVVIGILIFLPYLRIYFGF
jgi:diacylglycerol kinase